LETDFGSLNFIRLPKSKVVYLEGINMKLIMTAIALFMVSTIAFGDVEIALEAELANKIQAPIVIAVPEDAKAQGGGKPTEPSNDKFIWAPGPPVTGGGGSGFAEFIIDIPENDTYAIWGRVVAWDGNSDSLWVTWTPADPEENPQATQNTEFRWSTAQGNDWHWDRVNHWLDGGTFEREWELDKGETLLKIWSREDATMLDCLFISNNLQAESEGILRMPDDKDRQAQIEGVQRPVEPKAKLATTWAEIRSVSF
jgi:hypothetical protein